MTTSRVVLYEITCDLKVSEQCVEGFSALAGKTLSEALADAASVGWKRTSGGLTGKRKVDVCPKCQARLAGAEQTDVVES